MCSSSRSRRRTICLGCPISRASSCATLSPRSRTRAGARGRHIYAPLCEPVKPVRLPNVYNSTFSYSCFSLDKDFEIFSPYSRELRKKQQVTASSLQKIEDGALSLPFLLADRGSDYVTIAAVYTITVRTAEYDLPPALMDDLVARVMSDVTYHGSGERRDRRTRYEDEGGDNEY